MTAIAAIAENGKVYVGGDSAGSNDKFHLYIRKDEKVFINENFIIGGTTSYRMLSLLRYSFKPPKHLNKLSDEAFMNTAFINSVRKCFISGGFAAIDNNVEEGGTFVVGYKGNLYTIEEDFQVAIPLDNFAAVGCGDHLCLGSLCSSKGDPEARIIEALSAAERYSAGVRGPFIIKSL